MKKYRNTSKKSGNTENYQNGKSPEIAAATSHIRIAVQLRNKIHTKATLFCKFFI
jgi:hypothetical protein